MLVTPPPQGASAYTGTQMPQNSSPDLRIKPMTIQRATVGGKSLFGWEAMDTRLTHSCNNWVGNWVHGHGHFVRGVRAGRKQTTWTLIYLHVRLLKVPLIGTFRSKGINK
ncbi:Hypothetical predicted protein [Pelobates cultripes]|uniref:Uncharacterized protein n=1 Tax=Pelobates cultripes TaxID=61616 RepID=A0AAD1VY92_PELCU|nr:Hypothetical predicted protein [Pelobates cultripes]